VVIQMRDVRTINNHQELSVNILYVIVPITVIIRDLVP
jgi:hypothetical protein